MLKLVLVYFSLALSLLPYYLAAALKWGAFEEIFLPLPHLYLPESLLSHHHLWKHLGSPRLRKKLGLCILKGLWADPPYRLPTVRKSPLICPQCWAGSSEWAGWYSSLENIGRWGKFLGCRAKPGRLWSLPQVWKNMSPFLWIYLLVSTWRNTGFFLMSGNWGLQLCLLTTGWKYSWNDSWKGTHEGKRT